MSSRIDAPVTQDRLFVWLIHKLAETFENHAILKGGMVLRLLDSTHLTKSKKDVRALLVEALTELEGAELEVTMHSRMVQVDERLAKVESRLPKLRRIKKMSVADLSAALAQAIGDIDAQAIANEMAGLLPDEEMAGLAPRIRSAVVAIMEKSLHTHAMLVVGLRTEVRLRLLDRVVAVRH